GTPTATLFPSTTLFRSHVRVLVEAPAEAADEVDHGIEQRHRLPERRQHVDRVEAAAEERERSHDQHGHELQLLEAVGPDAEDERSEEHTSELQSRENLV